MPVEKETQRKQPTRRSRAMTPSPTTATPQQQADKYSGIKAAISSCNDNSSLLLLYNQHRNEVEGNAEIKALFTERKNQLKAA